MITINKVTFSAHEKPILQNISLTLCENKIAIIGANGSGKTSFLRLLNGLAEPDEGEIHVSGINTKNNGALIRKQIGLVFQNPDTQIIMPIVEEDLAFGLKHRGYSKAEIAQRTDSILNYYNIQHLRKQPVHSLSGGEKQLVAICAILITEPKIVLFDEPTSSLDLLNRQKISRLIKALPQQIIAATHDFELIATFDRAIVFDSGRVVWDGQPAPAIKYYVEKQL